MCNFADGVIEKIKSLDEYSVWEEEEEVGMKEKNECKKAIC